MLHHKFDNKVHTVVDHRWVHKTNIENVCDQDSDFSQGPYFVGIFSEAHFFLAVIFKSNFFLKAYLKNRFDEKNFRTVKLGRT